jgi:membrane-bound inhibitor of C-type lysozyme
MSPRILIGVVATGMSCGGCHAHLADGQPAAPLARTIAYRCPDHTGFRVAVPATGANVRLEGLASGPVTLPIVRSGSGARYSDGRTTYWSKGTQATLEIVGESPRACVVIADPATLLGSRWRLVRIQSMDDTETSPDDRSKYTLEFGAAGVLAGQADCNRMRGRWTPLASQSHWSRSQRRGRCARPVRSLTGTSGRSRRR